MDGAAQDGVVNTAIDSYRCGSINCDTVADGDGSAGGEDEDPGQLEVRTLTLQELTPHCGVRRVGFCSGLTMVLAAQILSRAYPCTGPRSIGLDPPCWWGAIFSHMTFGLIWFCPARSGLGWFGLSRSGPARPGPVSFCQPGPDRCQSV